MSVKETQRETVRMEDRIQVIEESLSTTQHQLAIYFDGVRQVSVDNSRRVPCGQPMTFPHGDYRDWMAQTAQEAAPGLKVWFLQRNLRFTTAPLTSDYERVFDWSQVVFSRRMTLAQSEAAACSEMDHQSARPAERMRA